MDIHDEVKQAISKELKIPLEQLADQTELAELGAESIDVIEIVFALEERYDIDISLKFDQVASREDEAKHRATLSTAATVGDVCRAVQALVDAKTSN